MPRKKLQQQTGELATRTHPDGRRRLSLTRSEREALVRQERAEAAAALFLALDKKYRWVDIAQELGISVAQLKEITKSSEFDLAWNNLYPEVGHDPRYKAARGAIADMLPAAVKELGELLESSSATVRYRAIEKIIELNGIEKSNPQDNDRAAAVQFLINNLTIHSDSSLPLPPEYLAAMDQIRAGSAAHEERTAIVEGQFREAENETA